MGSNPTISGFESHHLSRSDWVRIRRPEIGKLACQAEGERITSEASYPTISTDIRAGA